MSKGMLVTPRAVQRPCNLIKRSRRCKITSCALPDSMAQPWRIGAMNSTARSCSHVARSAGAGLGMDEAAAARDAEYNHRMAQQMGWQNAGELVSYQMCSSSTPVSRHHHQHLRATQSMHPAATADEFLVHAQTLIHTTMTEESTHTRYCPI